MAEDRQEQKHGGGAPGVQTAAQPSGTIAAAQVADYLTRHPDFFVDHPELLGAMTPPARDFGAATADPESEEGPGEVVDLQQYMLQISRARAAELEDQMTEIVGLAREGMQGQARVQAAITAIVGARSLDQLIEVATTDLTVLLDLDVAMLAVEGGEVPRLTAEGVRVLPEGLIANLLGPADVVLQDKMTGDKRLYGSAAGLVLSQALIRLDVAKEGPPAMLALGSRRPQEFAPGQGTDLMRFLGDVLAMSLRVRLDLPG